VNALNLDEAVVMSRPDAGPPYDAMVDLETLDTKPTSVILSIGAVLFDARGGQPKRPYYRVLKLQSQLNRGRTVSESTLLWWADQSEAARAEVFRGDGRSHPVEALQDLAAYLKPARRVWAQGPDFGCVILTDMARQLGIKMPWAYNSVRDVRTIREEAGMPESWVPSDSDFDCLTLTPHHPVSDCLWQVAVVTEARRRLRLGGPLH
jgi:hypothetical protein